MAGSEWKTRYISDTMFNLETKGNEIILCSFK